VQRHGHVAGFHSGERVALERKPVRAHERAAQTGAGHEHQHGSLGLPPREPRLGHAAVIAVVAHDQRDGASDLSGQRRAVIPMHVPAAKARGQIRRFAEHAVAFVGSRNREADAVNLRPLQVVLREKFRDARDPAADHGPAPVLRIRPVLQQSGADRLAIFPDRRAFGSGGAAVRADENFLIRIHF